jgi:hypothetical protein
LCLGLLGLLGLLVSLCLIALLASPPLRRHVHGSNGDEVAFGRRPRDATAPVPWAVEFRLRDPAFLQPGEDEGAEGVVVGRAGPVGGVEARFEVVAGRPVRGFGWIR